MFQPGQDVRKPLEHRNDVDGGATGDGIGGGTARRGGQPRTRIAGRSHTLPISCENCTRRAPFNYIICYKSSVGINQYLYFGNSLSHFYSPRILPNKVVLRKKEKTTEAGVQWRVRGDFAAQEKTNVAHTSPRNISTRTDNCGYGSVNSVSFQLIIALYHFLNSSRFVGHLNLFHFFSPYLLVIAFISLHIFQAWLSLKPIIVGASLHN